MESITFARIESLDVIEVPDLNCLPTCTTCNVQNNKITVHLGSIYREVDNYNVIASECNFEEDKKGLEGIHLICITSKDWVNCEGCLAEVEL